MVTEWTGIKGSVAYVSLFKNEVLSLTCTYELPAIWSQFLFLVNACKKVKELSWSCLLSWILNHHILIFVLMPVFLQTNFLLSSMFLVSWMSCYVVYFLVFCVFSVFFFLPLEAWVIFVSLWNLSGFQIQLTHICIWQPFPLQICTYPHGWFVFMGYFFRKCHV